jgi:uncharacterized protein YndB with AHSA1/START domain
MKNDDGKLKVAPQGDREIVITRAFNAPAKLVFDAYTKPELLKRWLTGPPEWKLSVCEVDLRVGGKYRYEWSGPNDYKMGMGGTYREVVAAKRVVATERFDMAWYPGEALVTLVFDEKDGRTMLRVTLQYESAEARDGVMKSPMESGMGASFDKMAALLEEIGA